MKTLFNLPKKVIFCKKCVESNQRYMGTIAHLDQKHSNKKDDYSTSPKCGHIPNYCGNNWNEHIKLWKTRERSNANN